MLVLEFKAYGKPDQFKSVDEAIRITQFIRNKSIRLWMDEKGTDKSALSRYTAQLAKQFPFANKLNSMARQASAERAWIAISRFYENCKKNIPGKKGFPRFQKDCRSVEYKTSGWKISEDLKSITFTDKCGIGTLKMKGTRDLGFYSLDQIKRVRIVRRADGHYIQFCVKTDRSESVELMGTAIGLDVGLKEFYTDSNGESVENPRFLRKAEKQIKKVQRRLSRKVKGSKNRAKDRAKLAKLHLKVTRQRKDHAVKLARCVVLSNDVIVLEDLKVRNLVRNHCLAKSISDASWYLFRTQLESFASIFGKTVIAINPAFTSQECSECGTIVKKSLSTRTHSCQCGCQLDRDHNAAINILNRGLNTLGHREIYAWGDPTSGLLTEKSVA